MFKEERDTVQFSWSDLGNIEEGRPHLGTHMPVLFYRLFEYTIRDVLISKFDVKTAQKVFVEAGRVAGYEFCQNVLNTDLKFENFLSELKEVLEKSEIGILQIEKADLISMEFVLTISEDLDCSGLPQSNETVCNYDEGFIKGILECYTEDEFHVTEISCWANGDRTCRFKVDIVHLIPL